MYASAHVFQELVNATYSAAVSVAAKAAHIPIVDVISTAVAVIRVQLELGGHKPPFPQRRSVITAKEDALCTTTPPFSFLC